MTVFKFLQLREDSCGGCHGKGVGRLLQLTIVAEYMSVSATIIVCLYSLLRVVF